MVSPYVTTGTAVRCGPTGQHDAVRPRGREDRLGQAGWIDAATDYDMFTHNELRARGEARVGVHVWRPSGIHTVTGF